MLLWAVGICVATLAFWYVAGMVWLLFVIPFQSRGTPVPSAPLVPDIGLGTAPATVRVEHARIAAHLDALGFRHLADVRGPDECAEGGYRIAFWEHPTARTEARVTSTFGPTADADCDGGVLSVDTSLEFVTSFSDARSVLTTSASDAQYRQAPPQTGVDALTWRGMNHPATLHHLHASRVEAAVRAAHPSRQTVLTGESGIARLFAPDLESLQDEVDAGLLRLDRASGQYVSTLKGESRNAWHAAGPLHIIVRCRNDRRLRAALAAADMGTPQMYTAYLEIDPRDPASR
jgi:hypothetical protein